MYTYIYICINTYLYICIHMCVYTTYTHYMFIIHKICNCLPEFFPLQGGRLQEEVQTPGVLGSRTPVSNWLV